MRLRSIPACALLAWLMTAAGALAQGFEPVTLTVTGTLGAFNESPGEYQTLVVRAENNTNEALHGLVRLSAEDGSLPAVEHEVEIDLPARAARWVRMTAFKPVSGTPEAVFEVGGRVIARATESSRGYGIEPTIAIIGEPSRLRGVLADQPLLMAMVPGGAIEKDVKPAVGTATIDPRSGQHLLPVHAAGYGTTDLVIAQIPALARATERERRALEEWVGAGGTLWLAPTSERDLVDPFVRRLLGSIAPAQGVFAHQDALVPPNLRGRTLSGERVLSEGFGASARVGFGRVYVTTFDPNETTFVDLPELHQLVRAMLSVLLMRNGIRPTNEESCQSSFGGGAEAEWGGIGQPSVQIRELRSALDPNDQYLGSVAFAALLLMFYVIIVGPLNFRWVARRGKPLLALITTPLLSFAAFTLLLLTGYTSKGITPRVRSVEIDETVSGYPRAYGRQYLSLFLASTGDLAWKRPEEVLVRQMGTGGGWGGRMREGGGERVLDEVRARLWQTIFLREDRVVDLGGPVVLEPGLAPEGPLVVHNRSRVKLRGAVWVDEGGAFFGLGAIEPGERVSRPRGQPLGTFIGIPYDQHDDTLTRFMQALGADAAHAPYFMGLLRGCSSIVFKVSQPQVFALLEPEDATATANGFHRDAGVRLLRVLAHPSGGELPLLPVSEPLTAPAAVPTP